MDKRYPQTLLATACVPWTETYEFDEPLFRQNVSLLLENGINNIYIFGTAGEGYAVSRDQYLRITKAFLDEMNRHDGAQPMVGVISLSMPETVERINLGIELGAKDFQISFPSWGAVAQDEGMNFLRTICREFPRARFMHYNNSLRSKTRLGAKSYGRLAEELPNLVAVKNPGLGLAELQEFHGAGLPLQFFNLEYAYGFASLIEQNGFLVSIAGLNFDKARAYFEAGKIRDIDAIVSLHRDFQCLFDSLRENAPSGLMDGAYDKIFVKAHIEGFPLRLYPPYEGLADESCLSFLNAAKRALPHWFHCPGGNGAEENA